MPATVVRTPLSFQGDNMLHSCQTSEILQQWDKKNLLHLVMDSQDVSCSRSGSNPLELFRNTFNDEMEYVWADFEAKLPDLFVADPGSCKVEIVEIVPSLEGSLLQEVALGDKLIEERYVVEEAATFKELDGILNVRHITLIIILTLTDYGN
jgi:hypothetical protein